jgi:hypothetical protein
VEKTSYSWFFQDENGEVAKTGKSHLQVAWNEH